MEIERIVNFITEVTRKSGREKVVIGMSGGVDSAVAAALCAETFALQKLRKPPASASEANVIGIWMPTKISPPQDEQHVIDFCNKRNIYLAEFPIQCAVNALEFELQKVPDWARSTYKITLANIQPRIRMTVLYTFANYYNALVCGTSNKTEYLVGYFTRWGDGVADFEPILHLNKREVYKIAKELEIPDVIINKSPSAGLWPRQTDEGELGITYEKLDMILDRFELQPGWPNGIAAKSQDEVRVRSMIYRSEFKRKDIPSLLKWRDEP
jgi:NAD+ synthase